MRFCFPMIAAVLSLASPGSVWAQDPSQASGALQIELNALQDTGTACRLTFVAQNRTGFDIEQAVFETVIFDNSGGVVSLSLFDFRDLPTDRPRVRQFDVPGISCDGMGQALINGSNTCSVAASESEICDSALQLSSRLTVELLG